MSGDTAYWLISKARYAELRTPEYVAEQDRLYNMAQTVGERETARRLPETTRLTWYHNDFGAFVPNIWVTPKLLSERYAEIAAERALHENTQPPDNSGEEEDRTMTNSLPSRETVAFLREQYPAGTRVELISMDDPHTKLKAGDKGTVAFVDDAGGVHTDWDSGSKLAALYGVDSFRKAEREIIQPQKEQPQPPPRSDGYTSVVDAIENGKKTPKPPRKVKAQGKAKSERGGDEI